MEEKQLVVQALEPVLKDHLSTEQISDLIETPSNSDHGDLAFPVFQLAKVFRKAPNLIAEDLVNQIDDKNFDKIEAVGPYINFFLNREKLSGQVISQVLKEGSDYGSVDLGHGQTVTLDYSSPNIAKPMSMGHLRSTVIGHSIDLLHQKVNYKTVSINHLGDWGTQFGKLIVAYKKWGDEATVRKDPVNELVKLYVEFHEKAEDDPSLEDEGRAAFKALEDGDPETVEYWKWFKEESIKDFQIVYDKLGIKFDHNTGESFYNDKMEDKLDILADKGVSTVENGATLVYLDEEELPPALVKRTDGATLYITRDIATAYYRKETFNFAKSLYIVGNEQANHFKQLKAILKRMGNDWSDDMVHIAFGLITLEGKKLSTRKGKIVLLEEVLNEAVELAQEQIDAKNPDLVDKEEVAKQVGIGAVVFHDLKSDRMNSFDFKLSDVVQFEGETGPYVQYTYARAKSLLEKYGKTVDPDSHLSLTDDYAWQVIKKLQAYSDTIVQAVDKYEPSVIARYVIQLAQAFNKYYGNVRLLNEDEELPARMALVEATSIVLKDGLKLLGVQAPENM